MCHWCSHTQANIPGTQNKIALDHRFIMIILICEINASTVKAK